MQIGYIAAQLPNFIKPIPQKIILKLCFGNFRIASKPGNINTKISNIPGTEMGKFHTTMRVT